MLTKPSKPAHNEGFDNEDYDYILYVNDWLGADEGHKYVVSFPLRDNCSPLSVMLVDQRLWLGT